MMRPPKGLARFAAPGLQTGLPAGLRERFRQPDASARVPDARPLAVSQVFPRDAREGRREPVSMSFARLEYSLKPLVRRRYASNGAPGILVENVV